MHQLKVIIGAHSEIGVPAKRALLVGVTMPNCRTGASSEPGMLGRRALFGVTIPACRIGARSEIGVPPSVHWLLVSHAKLPYWGEFSTWGAWQPCNVH